jgi:hypothetical protein
MSDINLVIGKIEDFPWSKADEFCGVICQTPDNLGNVQDHTDFFSRLKEH